MAEKSIESASSECLIHRQVWTFTIQGGQAFQLEIPTHPILKHSGKDVTLWKMVGTDDEAQIIENCIKALGCSVQKYTEIQTEEQLVERLGLLDLHISNQPDHSI